MFSLKTPTVYHNPLARRKRGVWRFGGLEVWKFGVWGSSPHAPASAVRSTPSSPDGDSFLRGIRSLRILRSLRSLRKAALTVEAIVTENCGRYRLSHLPPSSSLKSLSSLNPRRRPVSFCGAASRRPSSPGCVGVGYLIRRVHVCEYVRAHVRTRTLSRAGACGHTRAPCRVQFETRTGLK